MIINAGEIKHTYGSAQYQDMRKQINGLTVFVASCCNMDVMDHSILSLLTAVMRHFLCYNKDRLRARRS